MVGGGKGVYRKQYWSSLGHVFVIGSTAKNSPHQLSTQSKRFYSTTSLSQITQQFQMTLNRNIFAGKFLSVKTQKVIHHVLLKFT